MANTPDVRVRLSAEGVQEVVNAFRTIANESQQSSRKAADGVSNLVKLKLGEWAMRAAQYTQQFAAASLDAQEQISKLTTKTGMSAPLLSVLARSAKLADGDLGDLETSVKKLNTALTKLQFGDSPTSNTFSRLGLSAKDFIGLNADERFLKVATALGKVGDEQERSAIASALFGKNTGTLLIIADELARKGFPALRAETEAVHQVFDEKAVKAAEAFNDQLKDMKLNAEALAGKSLIGLKNVLDNVFQPHFNLARSVIQNGLMPGSYVPPSVPGWADTRSSATGPGGLATSHASTQAGLLSSHDTKETQKYLADLSKFQAEERARTSAHAAALQKIRTDAAKASADAVLNLRQTQLSREQILDDAEYAQGLMSLDGYYARRAGRINAGLVAELAAMGAKKIAQRAENAAELATIDAEIARTKALNGATADTRDLDNQRTAAILSGQNKIAALDHQAAQAVAKAQNQRLENTNTLTNAERELGVERLNLEQKIADAQGDTYKAALTGIQLEADALAKTLHTTVDDPRIKQLLALLTGNAAGANFSRQFDLQQRVFGVGTNQLDQTQQRLQNQVNAGGMFPSQAQAAYSQAVKAQLPELQQQLDLLKQSAEAELDAATTALTAAQMTNQDTTAKREAVAAAMEHSQALEQEQQKLNQMSTAANFSAQQMGYLKTGVEDALKSDLAGWLSSGIDNANSFSDAMRGLALSLVQSMRQIAAQVLANIVVYALMNKIGKADPNQAATKQMTAAVLMAAGGMIVGQAADKLQAAAASLMAAAIMLSFADAGGGGGGYASGGLVRGPGTGTSDSILARLSDHEYVFTAAAVRHWGVDTLNAMNRGMRPASVTRANVPRFADGGLVDLSGRTHGGGGLAGMTATLALDDALILKRFEASHEFSQLIVRTSEKHAKKINQALGR